MMARMKKIQKAEHAVVAKIEEDEIKKTMELKKKARDNGKSICMLRSRGYVLY